MHGHHPLALTGFVSTRSMWSLLFITSVLLLPLSAEVTAGSLHEAADAGDVPTTKRLVNAGANVNQPDQISRSPLHIAAARGHRRLVAVLLASGASENQTDASGATPLHVAAEEDEPGVARVLVEQRANLDARDSLGRTPLHKAALANSTLIIDLLLDNGADAEIRDASGRTAADVARENKSWEAARRLASKTRQTDYRTVDQIYKRVKEIMR